MDKSRRRFQFSLAAAFAATTVICIISCVGRAITRRIELTDVTYADANTAFRATVSPILLPKTAASVDVNAWFQGGEVSFDIAEEDFISWAKPKWDFEDADLRLRPEIVQKLDAHDWPTTATHVFYYSKIAPRGSGWTIMYDRSRKRAWMFYSPR